MSVTVTNVAREFTPAEASAVTGVSVAQQRDWRRRDLISEKEGNGWSRFDVTSIIDLAVLRFFTRMGFAPSSLSVVRQVAVLPTWDGIYKNSAGYEIVGDLLEPALRTRLISGSVGGASNHILVVTPTESGDSNVARVASYDAIDKVLDEAGSPNCIVLDCHKLADHLISKAGGPLVRVEVENT